MLPARAPLEQISGSLTQPKETTSPPHQTKESGIRFLACGVTIRTALIEPCLISDLVSKRNRANIMVSPRVT